MTVTSQRRHYIPWSLDWPTSSYLKVTGNAVSGAFEHRRSNYLFDTPINLYVAPNPPGEEHSATHSQVDESVQKLATLFPDTLVLAALDLIDRDRGVTSLTSPRNPASQVSFALDVTSAHLAWHDQTYPLLRMSLRSYEGGAGASCEPPWEEIAVFKTTSLCSRNFGTSTGSCMRSQTTRPLSQLVATPCQTHVVINCQAPSRLCICQMCVKSIML
jgi:hypothetical protein